MTFQREISKKLVKKTQDLRKKAEILRIYGWRHRGIGATAAKATPYSVMTMVTVAR